MTGLFRNKVELRYTMLAALVLAALFVPANWILFSWSGQDRFNVMVGDTEDIVAELGAFSRYSSLAERQPKLEELADGLFKYGSVTEFAVWDEQARRILNRTNPDGGPVLPVRSPEKLARILNKLKETKTAELFEHDGKYEILLPIFSLPNLYIDDAKAFYGIRDGFGHIAGYVRLVRHMSRLHKDRMRMPFIVYSFVLWLLCTVCISFLARKMVGRVKSVTEKMWAHSAGIEYEAPQEKIPDAFGKLASAFNTMAEREIRYRIETEQHIDLMTRQLEYFPDPSVFITDTGELLFANRRAAEFLGYASARELTELSPNFYQFIDRHSKRMFGAMLKQTEEAFRAAGPEMFSMVLANESPARVALSVSCIHDRIASPYFIVTMREAENVPSFVGDTAFTQNLDRHVTAAFSTAFEVASGEINNHALVCTLSSPRMRAMWNDLKALVDADSVPRDTPVGGYAFEVVDDVFASDCEEIMEAGLGLANVPKAFIKSRTHFDELDMQIDLNAAVRSAIDTVKGFVSQGKVNFVFHAEEEMPIFSGRHRHVETLVTILLQTACLPVTTSRKAVYLSTLNSRVDQSAVVQIVSGESEDPRDPRLCDTDTNEIVPADMWLSVAQKIADYNKAKLKMEFQEGKGLRMWLSFSISGLRQ